ncbi:MAG: Gfo/Idh/MocA family protein, partial [Bacteroidales bacterium]
MTILKNLLTYAVVAALFCSCATRSAGSEESDNSKNWHWNEGTIVVNEPSRQAGQESVIGLTSPKLEVVRVAFVGLGMRGPGAVKRFTYIPGVQIVALCDYKQENAERCQKYLKEASMPKAAIYSGEKGYEKLCKRDDIDLVYIATDWLHHFPVAEAAMKNGKHVAIEVPSAMNLDECWALVDMSEKTRKHCFILENCCYDWYEMNTLN